MTLSRRSFVRGLIGLVAAASLPVGVAFAVRRQGFDGILHRPQFKGIPTISIRRMNRGPNPQRDIAWEEGLSLKDPRYATRIQSVQSYMGVDYAHAGTESKPVFYVPRKLLEAMARA